MIKLAVKILVFSLVFIVILKTIFDPVFKKNNSFKNSIDQLYQLDKDSLDLLIFGSSHARNSYNTDIIDKALHINSFSLASGGQKIAVTNNLIDDILKQFKPKLIILDVFPGSLDYPKLEHQKSNQLQVFDNTKWTTNKMELLTSMYSFDELPSAVSPTVRNHQNWNKANWMFSEQKLDSTRAFFNKGFSGSFSIMDDSERMNLLDYEQRKDKYLSLSTNEIDPSKLKNELEEIKNAIEICKENNIELLLVCSPYFDAFYSKLASDFHFLVTELCEENNIKFLDFNTKFDELSLTLDDFRDRSHVNLFGADKVTGSLVTYLLNEDYFEINNSDIENLPKTLKTLSSAFELTFEKELNKELFPDVFVKRISMFENKEHRKIELILNKKEGVSDLLKKHNLEYIATPYEADKKLLEGKFKELNREIQTFYSLKDISINGQNKISVRIPKSNILKYKNIRLFSFVKAKRQSGQKHIIDLPDLDLSKTIESKFINEQGSSLGLLLEKTEQLLSEPFEFNETIKVEEIAYLNSKANEYKFSFKIKQDSNTKEFEKYNGYIRYYNGEVTEANKNVRGFPVTVLESDGFKYIFVTVHIEDVNLSKLDFFFIKKESKEISRFYTMKGLKLKKDSDL
ncbi:hypothetical protein [Psychroserpens sp.]|uniref:hypothetical protein n=1 Tax=Psychroserpens sp. TaxID=2020870 RepID=UPI002B267520|nr:hypothetical protein [Psychroserpens sp.]